MVENSIIQIVHTNLGKYVNIDDIKVCPSNGLLKYIFTISNCCFEIVYDFMDNLYRVKLEKMVNNEIKNVIFLTKSKIFQKDIQSMLKDLKLSRKSFENHVTGFTILLNEILNNYGNLNYIENTYTPNLKFDGIFI